MIEENGRFLSASAACRTLSEALGKANFNPAEPREGRGRWSSAENGANGALNLAIAYRGYYHDLVVDDFLDGLKARGSTVLKNVPVLGVNGFLAIPDGASKPIGSTTPYFLEMKTGNDPKFTPNQQLVYHLICMGGHATSFDARISQLGLTPGLPFPPLRIMVVVTSGPGQPIRTLDYCRSIGLEVPDMLDRAAAADLFAIVVSSTSGTDDLNKQRPWHVEDRGDAYLVVGSPYTMGHLVRYVKTHIYFAKADAKVLGIGTDGRPILTKMQEAEWRQTMTQEQYDAIVAESFDWECDGVRDVIQAAYGGVVNKPADAVAYAKVLLRGSPRGAVLAQGLLTAVERDNVWHIARAPDTTDVLTFSRTDGQRLLQLP